MRPADAFHNVAPAARLAPTLSEQAAASVRARAVAPPLPFDTFTFAGDVVAELTYAMNLLMAHIFALYSIGEFRLFARLSAVYRGLDELRVRLTLTALTGHETRAGREAAMHLLGEIPKKLAAKAARVNERSYDLDHHNTDISAYKAVLARDFRDGRLVARHGLPAQMAVSQQMCALFPKFPVNAHRQPRQFEVGAAPSARLVHEPPAHVLVDFRAISGSSSLQPEGFAGMVAYLYVRNAKKRLTEAFAVHTESVDDLVYVEKILAALFRNIPAAEVENNRVYLVAVLTEEIAMPLQDTFLPQVRRVKQGVAAGVADITRIFSRNAGALASGQAHQFVIRLFGSVAAPANNGWGELVDRIIRGSDAGIAVNPRAEKLVVALKECKHQLVDLAAEDGQPAGAPIARIKPIFYDPLADNYERLYLKMGRLTALDARFRDALLTVEIDAPSDPRVRFAKASNQLEKPAWQFVSVRSGEAVGEIVKVNGIACAARPARPVSAHDSIGLSLYANGVLVGKAETCYRSGPRIVELNKHPWTTLDFRSPGLSAALAQVQIHTEYIGKTFNMAPCIADMLQHLALLRDGAAGPDTLHQALVDMCKLQLYDAVRFFAELLDAVLDTADACLAARSLLASAELLLDAAFKALVFLLDTLFGKQDQYLYMFDTFVDLHRVPAPLAQFILDKIAAVFRQAQSSWTSVSRAVCRNLPLLMRIAMLSLAAGPADAAPLDALFEAAAFFVGVPVSALVNDQVLAIELPDYVLAFEATFDRAALLRLVLRFVDSIGNRGLGCEGPAARDHKVVVAKLLLVQRLFASKAAQDPANIHALVSKCVPWCMDVFLGDLDIDATRLAASVMNCVCDLVWQHIEAPGVNRICFSLAKHMSALARTFVRYNKHTRSGEYFRPKKTFTRLFPNDYPFREIVTDPLVGEEVLVEVLVEIATVFTYVARVGMRAAGAEGLLRIHREVIPDDFFDAAKCLSSNGLGEDITTVLSGVQLMRLGKYFPEDKWLSLYALIAEGCLQACELVQPLLLAHFVPEPEAAELFDRSLWGGFFRTLFKLGTLAPVAVEHLSTIPRKACHQITGSMRERIAALVNEAWDALAWDATEPDLDRFNLTKFGGFQVEFIGSDYGILQDVMLLALQRSSACQTVAVKIVWSILVAEYILSGSVVDVEKECLLGLHEIYTRTAYKPKASEQQMFIERLRATIRLAADDEAAELTVRFIQNLAGFLEVLNDLNSVPVGPEFDDDRTFFKLNINAYLKNANKPELFHSFINLMYEENVRKGDFIQAALSLELLASTYTWDHHEICAPLYRPKFPEQTAFERKEALVKMIAQNFIKGNSLERATDTYNELLEAYSEHTYDLKSFAYVHQKLAKLYLDLESSDKLSPSFFRVAYIGAGFPANIRGKEQIYEGLPFEHITSIHERMLNLYPGARIITDDQHAAELQKLTPTGRFLHVNVVEPVSEISDKILNTSIGVRQYARNKNLRFFLTTKKLPGLTSVFDLWTEEVTYETHVSFPTLMNRSEIKATSVVRLSPLENAIRLILNKTNEMVQTESMLNQAVRERADYATLLHDLSRQLAGTVDSPVNGGVGQFRPYFAGLQFDGNPDHAYNVRLLRNAFHDLTAVLSRCLHLHGKLVASNLRPSHDALVTLFRQNFAAEIDILKLNTNYDSLLYNHQVTAAQAARGASSGVSISGTLISEQALAISSPLLQRSNTQLSKVSSGSGSGSTRISDQGTVTSGLSKYRRTALNWRRS
ncbi:hypothetical protein METBIDRAFT_40289 [Metschnikowia bicuspidata var. bicuspidata NRRL YB-4993]|uniref:DOCKER domain-containing protein n=1 Tax=Metschnikowia bicuspidata var. bicuspidata NRRL YB-4993 TaxID=869754 RepID=A0A1A0HEY3_9ASCO|nr:hypothetical protein METBIDRAFT_40289 [Metschnikowia bicuspidata var. bicuspidata NRRL YB-4993]OBA22535.1 hypothetical protein METBIDRAFT_40289 [Metschnikowia bicuspidata var. bicuspidata NRRL YB-4993]